jgi:hypothetical protein
MIAAFFTFTVMSDLQGRPRMGGGIIGRWGALPPLAASAAVM